MTTEQAIKELKSDRELYGSDIVYAGDGTPEGDLMLALDMGIAALEKQIPKKPIFESEQTSLFGVDDVPYCPSCRCELPEVSYCEKCGQALDWSDTDEMPNIKSKE